MGAMSLEKAASAAAASCSAGVPGVPPAQVACSAAASSAQRRPHRRRHAARTSSILDVNLDRMRYLETMLDGRITPLSPPRSSLEEAVQDADLVIGAVLMPGARAPKLVTRDDAAS